MGREAMIRADMERGHVQPYFEGTIRQLAKTGGNCPGQKRPGGENGGQMVSELVNKTGGKYTAKDPHYAVVDQLRKDVQALRNQLGLTPTSLRRAKQEASHNQGKAGWMSYWKRPMIMRWNTRLHTRPRWMPMWKRVFPGEANVCVEIRQACERYLRIFKIQSGSSARDRPTKLLPSLRPRSATSKANSWTPHLCGGRRSICFHTTSSLCITSWVFYITGTQERRFKEALDFIPRKNIKTTFAAALAWGAGTLREPVRVQGLRGGRRSSQALEGFDFLRYNLKRLHVTVDDDPENGLRIINNNMERSITGDVGRMDSYPLTP